MKLKEQKKFGILWLSIGAALFVGASFVTMCFVRHGDSRAEAKSGLAAFEDMDD